MLWRYSQSESKVLLIATLLVFAGYGLLLARDMQIARHAELLLTAQTVGVLVGVEENGVNTLVRQLEDRERALLLREQALGAPGTTDSRTLLLVALVGSGLLGLILLNFYLDSRRRVSLAG